MKSDTNIQERIVELDALKAQAARWKFGSTLFTIVVVVGCVLSILNNVKTLTEDGPRREDMTERLKEGINQQVVPEVRMQAQRSLLRMKPMLAEEFQHIDSRSMEVAQRFFRELRVLEGNVADETEGILDETFGAALAAREETVRRLYPEASRERMTRLAHNFYGEFEKVVMKVTEDLFTPHMAALGGVVQHVNKIRDEEKIPPDAEFDLDVALLVLDIVRNEFDAVETEITEL